MRSLENPETSILKGKQIFRNCIREHEGPEEKTPVEACGIEIEGQIKWMTLIQNASPVVTVNRQKKLGVVSTG